MNRPIGRLQISDFRLRIDRFHDHVRVCAAETKRADAGNAATFGARPTYVFRWNDQSRVVKLDVRIERFEVRLPHDLFVLHHKHDLDQTGDAGNGFHVADVGLDAGYRTRSGHAIRGAENLRQGHHFDRVAERRASAVGFDVVDV